MVSKKNATSASERLIPISRPTALSSSGVGSFALAIDSSFIHCRRTAAGGAPPRDGLRRAQASLLSQAHLLIRRGEVQELVQADGRLLEPWTDSVQGGGLEDRGVHDAVVHQLLDLIQQRLAPLAIALA